MEPNDKSTAKTSGFSSAYVDAGKSGSHVVVDEKSGFKIDVKKAYLKNKGKDLIPGQRDAIATRAAAHVKSASSPRLLDVGCAIGDDVGRLIARVGAKATVYGVDIMESMLEIAREQHPKGKFIQAGMHKLPFEDGSMDTVQCSRLLWHAKDLKQAVAEQVRVLKPGGFGAMKEGNAQSQGLFTEDPRIRRINDLRNEQVRNLSAHPAAAIEVYAALLAHPDTENVTIESQSHTYASIEAFDPGLAMEKRMLEPLVRKKVITQEDLEYYLAVLLRSPKTGETYYTMTLFVISYTKREKQPTEGSK
mmetsp:Transcript_22737/g.42697  ORF Transcript_22737/g.42697 Transcript_22737/m.42697 type:complete len:305 (-) Transcript_22737:222-1136(-)